MEQEPGALVEQVWRSLGGADLGPPRLTLTGEPGWLPSRFAVEESVIACVGAALCGAAALQQLRSGALPDLSLDRAEVAAAVRSERYFRYGGEPAGASFAPLSRFWRAADGWVRTHANYPWHRAALLRALRAREEGGEEAVATAVAELPAREVEERVFAAGGVAAAVRSPAEWRDHPQGVAVSGEPLVGRLRAGDAPPRPRPPAALAAAGVRVLDLTRVIAGPVCTRFLGALGAQVLRLDPPARPDLPFGLPADTLLGKRSATLDLASARGLATLHALLDGADVVVHGYRPGSLDRFGLAAETMAERHPGLVAIYLDAWGHTGPWAGRRGFDSIVQAASGIAAVESADGDQPGVLPCQLLDHGSGYLAAAAALDGLREQGRHGGTQVRRLSLARTAHWLAARQQEAPPPAPAVAEDAEPPSLVELGGAERTVSAVPPPGRLDGRALSWPRPVGGYGSDRAEWLG